MKQRIDELLVERELADSLKEAVAMVMAGEVSIGERRVDKSGEMVAAEAEIRLKTKSRYVSRAGDKLASVVDDLDLDFKNKFVLDVGSSTGGFTDLALQYGAAKVWSVDVGNAQLAYKLRQDPRIVLLERTDIRELAKEYRGELADMALVDVSFVKLEKILPSVASLIKSGALIVAMMKPQFEADKTTADRFKGVINDESVRREIIDALRTQISEDFEIVNEADSKVPGAKGNWERFFLLRAKH